MMCKLSELATLKQEKNDNLNSLSVQFHKNISESNEYYEAKIGEMQLKIDELEHTAEAELLNARDKYSKRICCIDGMLKSGKISARQQNNARKKYERDLTSSESEIDAKYGVSIEQLRSEITNLSNRKARSVAYIEEVNGYNTSAIMQDYKKRKQEILQRAIVAEHTPRLYKIGTKCCEKLQYSPAPQEDDEIFVPGPGKNCAIACIERAIAQEYPALDSPSAAGLIISEKIAQSNSLNLRQIKDAVTSAIKKCGLGWADVPPFVRWKNNRFVRVSSAHKSKSKFCIALLDFADGQYAVLLKSRPRRSHDLNWLRSRITFARMPPAKDSPCANHTVALSAKSTVALSAKSTAAHSDQSKYSKVGVQWLNVIAKYKGIDIQHAENGGELKISTKESRVNDSGSAKILSIDGFCANNMSAFEFHGCYWHGCENCYCAKYKNGVSGKTMGELHESTKLREQIIKSIPYIEQVHTMWECEWQSITEDGLDPEKNTKLKKYLESLNAAAA